MEFEYIKFNQLLLDNKVSTITPSLKLQTDDIKESGATAVISQDQEFIIGYTDLIDKRLVDGSYIIFGDHTEVFKWIDFPFAQGADGIKIIKVNEKYYSPKYLFYALKSCYYPTGFYQRHFKLLKKTYIPNLSMYIQQKIASILNNYDELIENNNKRIKLLEEMAENLYKEWFVRFRFPGYETAEFENGIPKGWGLYKAGEKYGITIGKTPPRAESQWFTDNDFDAVDWSSIADMRNGIFLQRTSEQLTQSAMCKFHMPRLPKRTIIVSFKLTVGLVSITSEEVTTTNEAIAHFIPSKQEFEYLYLLLKNYNYKELGNTSSIGNAVNSKIIKKMNLLFPTQSLIESYHNRAKDIFSVIEKLYQQNKLLTQQRDLLLPRLMSGKLEVK